MIDNVNLLKLINTVDQNDENGIKYVKLIESAIIDNRACIRKYSTSKIKENKEKFFKNINKPYIYCEVHHIIPKCCGGTDEADNLVYLYCTEKYPEHIKAHEYLWKTTSIFSEFHSQLTASFFKMTHSRKLSSTLTIQEAARLREEYGNWKHETLSKKYGKNKRAKKILYNGVVYPSSNSMVDIEIDGSKHNRHTIYDWAKYGEKGLRFVDEEPQKRPEKKKSDTGTKILYKNKMYSNPSELIGIVLEDNIIYKDRHSILLAAKNNKHGLSIVDISKMTKARLKRGWQPKQKIKIKKGRPSGKQLAESNRRSIKIVYNGKVYPSARQLEKVKMYDDKYHSKGTILSWARENKHNLSLYKK